MCNTTTPLVQRALIAERTLHDPRPEETCGAVISTQEMAGVATVRHLLPARCVLHVYDKAENPTRACQDVHDNARCYVTPNVGREFETYLRHVETHYDDLPDRLILMTGVFDKHDRLQHFQRMVLATVLSPTPDAFWCLRQMRECEGFWDKPKQNVSQYQRYGMLEYEGDHPVPAVARPLGVFVRDRLQPYQQDACLRTCVTGVCHYGLFSTTRELLHVHPREAYLSMLSEFPSNATNPEAGFFLEMIAELAFGYGASGRAPDASTPGCNSECTLEGPNTVDREGNATVAEDPAGADPRGSLAEYLWPERPDPESGIQM